MRLRPNFVFKITCQRSSAFYLGETTRNLHTRICEHIGILPHTSNDTSYFTTLSSNLTHKRETGQAIFFDNFSVLARNRSELDTLFKKVRQSRK